MLEERGLKANKDKAGFIVCGTDKYKRRMEKDLETVSLEFGSFIVKRKVSDKYLGQVIHEDGVEKSADATVKDIL